MFLKTTIEDRSISHSVQIPANKLIMHPKKSHQQNLFSVYKYIYIIIKLNYHSHFTPSIQLKIRIQVEDFCYTVSYIHI